MATIFPVRCVQIGEAFNTVLAYRDPLLPITYDNYMKVRELQDFLKSWIGERIGDIQSGKTKNPEKTMAWHWLKNAGDGSHFSKKDVVVRVLPQFRRAEPMGQYDFRDHVALVGRRRRSGRASVISEDNERKFRHCRRRAFLATGAIRHGIVPRDFAERWQRLHHPVMREQAPTARLRSKSSACRWNGIATSARRIPAPAWIRSTGRIRIRSIRNGIFAFPTSAQINDDKCRQIGLARCPFDITNFEVKDGRKANITNSGFGTVFGVVDGRAIRFVTMPASLRSALDTDGVQVSN